MAHLTSDDAQAILSTAVHKLLQIAGKPEHDTYNGIIIIYKDQPYKVFSDGTLVHVRPTDAGQYVDAQLIKVSS
jgi:hypothetical protein